MTYRIVSHLFSYRNEFTTDEALHIRTIAYNCTIMYLLKELAKFFYENRKKFVALSYKLVRETSTTLYCSGEL